VWDLEALLERSQLPDSTAGVGPLDVSSLVRLPSTPERVYVATSGKILALDERTGSVAWERTFESSGFPSTEITNVAGDPAERLVVGLGSGVVHVIDPAGSAADTVIDTRAELARVRVGTWNGRPVMFAAVSERRSGSWSVRVWDLANGREIKTSSAYSLSAGEEDKRIQGLALHENGEAIRLAFASKYGKVMVADFTGPVERHIARQYETWHIPGTRHEYVSALAAGDADGMALLAAGTEYGALALWRFDTGEEIACRPDAHLNQISALDIGVLDGMTVLATGGADGVMRLWTMDLAGILGIDLGEPISALVWTRPGRIAVGTKRGVLMFEVSGPRVSARRERASA
jgi:WD40 repeat protein